MHELDFKVRINKKEVNCKSFSLKEYLKFLLAKTSKDSSLIKQWMIDVLKSNTNFESLTKHDCELLIINLLSKSIHQDDIKKQFVCDCDHEFDVTIDPTKIYVNYNDCEIENLYTFQNFKLGFRYPDLFEDDNIPLMILKSIEYIYVEDDRILLDDLSESELDDLYTAISPNDMENISKILLKPKIQSDIPIVCSKCGKSHVHSVIGFKSFVELLK